MDELYGILTAYELRIGHENLPKEEEAFKVLKKTKNQKSQTQPNHHEESDEEEANFIKKLQKGSGKYKGKLPLKCFNCVKVGHFASKCPYPKEDHEDKRDTDKSFKKKEKPYYKKSYYKGKKKFFTKEEDNNSSESSDSDEDEVLFLGVEEINEREEIEHEEDLDIEVEVNLEAKLISALSKLIKERKENKLLKEEVKKLKGKSCKSEKPDQEEEELSKEIEEARAANIRLKIQLEEARRT